ncbi:hypothetical protein C8J57DRAFT_1475019 [Mycena rebaudengoi]|nr:hypothetical protein C8J57DRAFT_1475019 [Mycena rebaudengoi]
MALSQETSARAHCNREEKDKQHEAKKGVRPLGRERAHLGPVAGASAIGVGRGASVIGRCGGGERIGRYSGSERSWKLRERETRSTPSTVKRRKQAREGSGGRTGNEGVIKNDLGGSTRGSGRKPNRGRAYRRRKRGDRVRALGAATYSENKR